ncbi:transcriptional regulator, LysR family [Rhodoferax ferrireducens T118]|uniref:Transcriptional regulator, LysR family n=1 Tax=Albidiferax ferrireducens (strain ATCC BAA-621 / DSM 15236 / T118) TaxID=338969 RepID=Q221S7_ALBFT|nr:LysR family transcriptional regulator [Rhodoferax ferrireducens]ABD68226.1 transcriptional regulator, LysR family [Rhodoferax ferrireducens T118]
MELLNDMALFVEVVNAKGFRGAADATGVPNSTVSRRIALLEKAIGLRLLHRTTRRVELTEAGRIYYERCRRIVDEARIAHEQLGEMLAQPSGVLRASLPVDFASIYLAPIITEFAQHYPGIRFEFDLTPRRVDLITEPFDVAIRVGDLPDSTLIARQLASIKAEVFASPGYLAKAGEPQIPSDLSKHECLGFPKVEHWVLQSGVHTEQVPVSGRYVLNNVGMFRRLATLDQGLILLPRAVVAEDIQLGRLRHVLPGWHGKPQPVYALTETRLLPAKTQRFIEFVRDRIATMSAV